MSFIRHRLHLIAAVLAGPVGIFLTSTVARADVNFPPL